MTFPSAQRYIAVGHQSALGTPAAAPTIALPVVKSQSKVMWNMNLQDEKYATGDLYLLVDAVPVKPLTSGTIVFPFKPHVLNTYLGWCSYLNGSIPMPSWLTFFIGDGYTEHVFSDVLFTSGTMACDNGSGPAMWTQQFMGLHPSTTHAVRDVSGLMPAYERSFRLENLLAATILANTAALNIEAFQWYITAGVTAYYGSKGDGSLGPSDLIINELGATMSITRAALDNLVQAAYVNSCGAPGDFLLKLQTSCGTTYSHSFELPNGLIDSDDFEAPDDLPIHEAFTVKGLRVAGGSPSPAQIVIV